MSGTRIDAFVALTVVAHTNGAGVEYVVETPAGVLYFVFIDSGSDVAFAKSTDRGLTWSDRTTVFVGTAQAVSIWFDRWSGIAAGLIHCAYTETGGSDVLYRSIDTENSDTLSTQTTIFAGASAASAGNLSITRTRGGNLLCHAMIDAGAEGGFFRSVDVGANWTSRSVCEAIATQDQIIVLPGWAADNQDSIAFFWDASANEVDRYVYDDSADTWSLTNIATGMVDVPASTTYPHWAAAVDIANSQNVLVAWSAVDTASADLRCWKVTESAITEVTNVVLDSVDDQALAAIGINTNDQSWWVAYAGKSDGSETWATAVNYYCKVSKDSGATWGPETVLSSAVQSARWMVTCPRFSLPFGFAFYTTVTTTWLRYNASIRLPRASCVLGF